MGAFGYIVYLVLAVVLTAGVGRVLFRSGEPFLEEVFRSKETARSLNVLLTVLFHLLTLGVLLIVADADVFAANGIQAMVTKTGIALVIVGIAYGISMLVLFQVRQRRRALEVSERVTAQIAEQRRRPAGEQVPPV